MPAEAGRGFAELRGLAARAATRQGRNELALPGLSVVRADAPLSPRKGWAHTLSIGVILQGQKRVRVAGRELTYDPGQYLLVTGEAEIEAAILDATASHPYLSLSVQVDPALVARLMVSLAEAARGENAPAVPELALAPEAAYVSRLDAAMTDTLVRLLRALDDTAEREVLAPLVLEELVFRLLRSDSAARLRKAATRGGDERRIQEAMAFIRERATERLTVEQIARCVAMSPSHFAHRFRDVVRVSPMRYLKHVRLHRARLLLIQGGARPAEAAAAVGYASTSHFTRDFKSYFEVPPGEYAQRFRARLDVDITPRGRGAASR